MNEEVIGDYILQALPDAKERRRYALLQAAAILRSNITLHSGHEIVAVNQAEALLAEVEKREKEQV